MRPKWFIENEKFGEDVTSLINEVKRQGMEVKTGDYLNLIDGGYYDAYPEDECVIYQGTLNAAAYMRKNVPWIPGPYYHPTDYDCINYYPPLGKYLLNSDYIMLPWGDLRRQKEFLYDTLAEEDTIFLRPNSGLKLFTGKLIYKELFDNDINILAYKDPCPHDLVIAARPRMVMNEWRFVCVDKKIVSGSQYRFMQNRILKPNDDTKALEYAQEVAEQSYQPARVWIIDICQTQVGYYYLLEVGCFSCAGLYMCPLEPIVREVSCVALEEWSEYN
jgi:hypothetical protein